MARAPWGELPIADAHVHLFSHAFYSGLARQKGLEAPSALGPLLGWEIPGPDISALASHWNRELARHDVSRAALIGSSPGDEASVSAAVASFPERFFGYFMLDPTLPDALARVETAARDPHLHCICLFPAMHRYSVADPSLRPLLEVASGHNLAVFVHCGAISVGVRKKLGLPSPFDLRFSNPVDLHPVALQYPKLRFVIPHFGAGMFREALMVADLCPNVYLDTSSSNHWMMYEDLSLLKVFRRAVDLLGPERLLFGTDSSFFPRGWHEPVFQQQTQALYELGLSRADAEKILHSNLEHVHAVSGLERGTTAKRHE